jgi:lipid-A-disaccharide synthase
VASGEVSGDMVAAALALRIRALRPDAVLFGLGGPRSREAGIEVEVETSHLGTVGITEAMRVVRPLFAAWRALRHRVRRERPDAAVLVGNDVFSVLLARLLRAEGVPTVSFFPPQVWIWEALARPIARSFDLVLTCFPAEERVYSAAGARTLFVGHHLAETLQPTPAAEVGSLRRELGLTASRIVALLPGSRAHEIESLAPILLDAAALLAARDAGLGFVLPVADPTFGPRLEAAIEGRGLAGRVECVPASVAALRVADVIVGASGTASLEAALLGVPMVLGYRVAPVTWGVVRSCLRLGLLRSDVVGLPNLVLGRAVVPELIQHAVEKDAIAREVAALLDDASRREAVRTDLAQVRERLLVPDGLGRAAHAILDVALAGAARPVRVRVEAPLLAPADE